MIGKRSSESTLTITLFLQLVCRLARQFGIAEAVCGDPGSDRRSQGGLVVHLGCGDGKLTAALRANDSYLVHGLDADLRTSRRPGRHIQSLGSVRAGFGPAVDGERLPYVDNLVNLVVADSPGQVPMDEVMRVLVPGGVALDRRPRQDRQALAEGDRRVDAFPARAGQQRRGPRPRGRHSAFDPMGASRAGAAATRNWPA